MLEIVDVVFSQLIHVQTNQSSEYYLLTSYIYQIIVDFLTKYKKWEYQKEWRLIGKANDKMKAPIIKCIYLGSNVKEENASALLQFAKKHNIKIVYM